MSCAGKVDKLYVLIDALDELQSPQNFVDAMSKVSAALQVKILITTRPRIGLIWPTAADATPIIDVRSSLSDVLKYVDRRLDEAEPTKFRLDDSARSRICQVITAKSDER